MMSNVKRKIVEPRQHKILGRLSNCYDCQTDHQTDWYTIVRSSDCDEIFIKINPLIQKQFKIFMHPFKSYALAYIK